MSVLPGEASEGKFYTFQRKVPHFISEAVGTIGQCRDWPTIHHSRFDTYGVECKTDTMTVLPFESVYNGAEVGKDMPIQAESQIRMRPDTSLYIEHVAFMTSLVRVAWPSCNAMTNRSKRARNYQRQRVGAAHNHIYASDYQLR